MTTKWNLQAENLPTQVPAAYFTDVEKADSVSEPKPVALRGRFGMGGKILDVVRLWIQQSGSAISDAMVGTVLWMLGISLFPRPQRRFYAMKISKGTFVLTTTNVVREKDPDPKEHQEIETKLPGASSVRSSQCKNGNALAENRIGRSRSISG